MNEKALEKILNIFSKEILPLTEQGVAKGSKIFGAAIIKKEDLSLVVAETNNEVENPLWHGEINTLKKFYELDANSRPKEKDCIFLSSHEPCSMCLSAITFSGFDNFYYLFPYTVTSDEFNIPHDLNILKEVFKINDGEYNKENSYWKSQDINLLIESLPALKKEYILNQLDEIKKKYQILSNQYQENKDGNSIPLN
ncbi:nucleoside deaminase [Candidatus Pelagibacter sp.]|nr:nucleoside deaminase [Candidatus Pelagibacter sp.]